MVDGEIINSEATIKLRVGDQVMHTAAEGRVRECCGQRPQKALGVLSSPQRDASVDYKVRVLMQGWNGSQGTVLIEPRLTET